MNPSNSFKDRVVSVATTMARAFGYEAISCASTGNLANATAAHAAKAGIECYVFVPDDLERAKILATEAYGAKVVAVKGNYDDVNRLCSEVADALPWAFVNVNMRPYYAEGSKSLGFETAEQLGLAAARPRGRADRERSAAHEDPSGVRRVDRDRRGRGEAVPRERRAARRLPTRWRRRSSTVPRRSRRSSPTRSRARSRSARRPTGTSRCKVARQTGGPHRVVHRAGDPRGHPAAREHRGRVHRDGRRRHDREPRSAWSTRASCGRERRSSPT